MKFQIAAILTLVLCLTGLEVRAQGGFDPIGMSKRALAQPFVGLTTDGKPQTGLYALKETGVSTEPLRAAARTFMGKLTPDQRQRVSFPMDHDEWRNWSNIHRFPRKGVSLKEMTPAQRDGAYGLLRTSLSAKGYETSRDIMRLNHHLAELVDNFEDYGEHLYYFIVFGDPSTPDPWGWQIEGHHLIVNYVIIGDQVVMTPTFMGSEPVHALSGKYKGTRILEPEQDRGLDFMRSLPPELQQVARIGPKSGRSENKSEMFKDNIVVPYAGLRADRLDAKGRVALLDLIGLFVGNMTDSHAKVKMEEVRRHLNETRFVWIGETGPDAVFYYRIHSPVLWIEFDHQGPIALDGSRRTPTRRHVHTVVRSPNGNDYGKDLLRQHYEKHKHDPGHGHAPR